MNFKNLIGWLTFFVGLSIILFSLYSSYNIFTAKKAFPEIFKAGEALVEKEKPKTKEVNLQKEMEKMMKEQLRELIPAETLPKLLNLLAWSMLAGILIFGGSQIAGLGIKLVKS